MAKRTFDKHSNQVHQAVLESGNKSMQRAADAVLSQRADQAQPRDVPVSTDGTWMRRGHSSLYGIQTVISWDTHQVLDVEVLSQYCSACTSWNSRKVSGKVTDEEFTEWQALHLESCAINTDVSAPAMESTSVVSLWKRSEEKRGLCYTQYIGDGDSKGYHNVVASDPYGETVVVKEECIGHVQKRLGKGLRDLKVKCGSEKLSDGKPLGGKGWLTDKKIDSLQNYYGIAVRKHAGDVPGVYRAIWASVCHEISTDEKPMHQYCPSGESSWCHYQGAQVTGFDFKHKPALPMPVFEKMKPIYYRLTDRQLLDRCTRGATQNANESLNGVIWHIYPKESFCGLRTVETAVNLAIGMFSHGTAVLVDVLTALKCNVGQYTRAGLAKMDQQRLYHSVRKSSEQEMLARKGRRATKKGFSDAAAEKEGVTYTPGGF